MRSFEDRLANFHAVIDSTILEADKVNRIGLIVIDAMERGNKVMFCGNGGSAADSIHIAAELVGRFKLERLPLAAVSLTADISSITAIANDYGFEYVFSRQVQSLGKPGDVLFGLSTSGNSSNVINAGQVCKELGITFITLTGLSGDNLAARSDVSIKVPSIDTAEIQEIHKIILHYVCEVVDHHFAVIP